MKSSKRKLYNIYNSNLDLSVATIRKKMPRLLKDRKCKTAKDRQFAALSVIYDGMYRETQGMNHLLTSINAVQAIHEFNWINYHDRNIVFPASQEILDQLYAAKFSVKNADFITDEGREFVLATPKGYRVDDYAIPSCLVSVYKLTNTFPIWQEMLKNSVGIDAEIGDLNMDGTLDLKMQDMNGIQQIIRLEEPNNRVVAITYQSNDGMTMQCQFELDDFVLAVSAKNADQFYEIASSKGQYSEELPDENTPKSSKRFGLTERELEQQYRLFRLVAAMLIYTTAEPDSLKAGFPSQFTKSKGAPIFEGQYEPSTFSLTGAALRQKASPKGHFRSFHYRQLMHEKYYQGDYANMAPGSRIVFVRESYIGEQVTPETLVEA